jgi:hypothetical protein
MPNADVVQKGLWACSIVLQAALVLRIMEKNLLFGLRWFVAWMAAEVAFAMLLICTPIESVLYLNVWNLTQPALCLLRVAAGWEVIRRTVNIRTGRGFTRCHALGIVAVMFSLALGAVSLRIEMTILQGSAWEFGVVLVNRAVWTSIATLTAALLLVRRIRPPWSLDGNTVIQAALLSALACVETSRYLVAACSRGKYTVIVNIVGLFLESLLFAIWIALLKTESEVAQMPASRAA